MHADIDRALAKVTRLRQWMGLELWKAQAIIADEELRNAAPALLHLVECLLRERSATDAYGPEPAETDTAIARWLENA